MRVLDGNDVVGMVGAVGARPKAAGAGLGAGASLGVGGAASGGWEMAVIGETGARGAGWQALGQTQRG